MLNTFI